MRHSTLIAMGICFAHFGCKKSSGPSAADAGPSLYRFEHPENTACISCRHIVNGSAPILYVAHDADDGGWQFLCGGDHTEDDAMIVGMGEVVKIDPSVNELYEMPEGVAATRDNRGGPWKTLRNSEQASSGQPATRSESDSEGSDQPEPEEEGRSR